MSSGCKARAKKTLAEDIPVLKKDGKIVYVDVNSVIILIRGKPHLMGIFRDITEKKKAEQELKQKIKKQSEKCKGYEKQIKQLKSEIKKFKKK